MPSPTTSFRSALKKFAVIRAGHDVAEQSPTYGESFLRVGPLTHKLGSIISGAGSILDIGATGSKSPRLGGLMDDVRALNGDVNMLKRDLESVLKRHRKQVQDQIAARPK